MNLMAQISALIDKGKERSKAENKTGDSGPVVTEVDIQHSVSSWTESLWKKSQVMSLTIFSRLVQQKSRRAKT